MFLVRCRRSRIVYKRSLLKQNWESLTEAPYGLIRLRDDNNLHSVNRGPPWYNRRVDNRVRNAYCATS